MRSLPPAWLAVSRLLAPALVLLLGAAPLARAQAAPSGEQAEAYAVISRLFDAMRARDTTAMRSAFVRNASMQTLVGDSLVRFEPIDGWLIGVARAPAGLLLDERLANPVIHMDGPLAVVWVDYWFFAGERFSHCGADAFQLMRQRDGWRVYSVVDTRRSQGCTPAPQK
ncbi:MAG: nuclear transport factor 2 family protein [Gemmatimonadaceae bacterium]|nr:nuclear transport factor 2 family protein [Gemmatimonadaceae bacterium]